MDLNLVVQELWVDLWVCNYYRVLPTDERFKKLTEKQKGLLIKSFLEQPTDMELHMAYQERQKREREFSLDYDSLRKSGFSEEQIGRMRREMEKIKEGI